MLDNPWNLSHIPALPRPCATCYVPQWHSRYSTTRRSLPFLFSMNPQST